MDAMISDIRATFGRRKAQAAAIASGGEFRGTKDETDAHKLKTKQDKVSVVWAFIGFCRTNYVRMLALPPLDRLPRTLYCCKTWTLLDTYDAKK